MTNEAIEAAARAICQELGIRNWDETAEDRGDLRMKVRGAYNTYDVNEPTKMDLRDAARAAAPALMEEGARLALEAAEYAFVAPGVWTQPWKVLRKLDPAAIVKGAGHE